MMLKCSACQEEKDEDKFHFNKSHPTGRDCYCKECRRSYYKNGRTWPDRKERNMALKESGFKNCSGCKQRLALDQFYPIKNIRYGYSAYCRECNSKKGKEYFSRPDVKAKTREYYMQPHVIEREQRRQEASPRHSINVRLCAALRRRPTENPVTIDQLMEKWKSQGGLCLVSGVRMTWKGGVTKPTSISIDRIDSKRGYTEDNVRLVCCMVNIFKGRWSDAEMLAMAKAIVSTMEKSSEPTWQPHLVHSEAA